MNDTHHSLPCLSEPEMQIAQTRGPHIVPSREQGGLTCRQGKQVTYKCSSEFHGSHVPETCSESFSCLKFRNIFPCQNQDSGGAWQKQLAVLQLQTWISWETLPRLDLSASTGRCPASHHQTRAETLLTAKGHAASPAPNEGGSCVRSMARAGQSLYQIPFSSAQLLSDGNTPPLSSRLRVLS